MTVEHSVPLLANLEAIPYLDPQGMLPQQFEGKIGVYAIFADDQALQYVGYSRDIYLSLKQHLVRQPQLCYWLKVQTIERPNRTQLENIRSAWIQENGAPVPGNQTEQPKWEQAIDVKAAMTAEELAQHQDPQLDERSQLKALKNAARRLEAEILEVLSQRGLQESLRFNPKLKETGFLDLK
ncbi:GIY-YIG nuclease family protein [Acaryochloris sp. IP29b_bin.148]|uniref:GIY-YIG nuclease family protein n=1 Tax=Acaryochloris sp. IP29b_bin.148 TaxID=2969218 RepID=UPI0026364AA0|nr:GIY-YIG nuclease family protein [Acaryochloris sp. IP29b_bin.148]